MPWHLVTRALFIAAVGWSAALTRAFHPALSVNIAVGVTLGLLIVLIETRLRSTEVTDLLGALIGGGLGLGVSKTIGAAPFSAHTPDRRGVVFPTVLLHVFPFPGVVLGRRGAGGRQPPRAPRPL